MTLDEIMALLNNDPRSTQSDTIANGMLTGGSQDPRLQAPPLAVPNKDSFEDGMVREPDVRMPGPDTDTFGGRFQDLAIRSNGTPFPFNYKGRFKDSPAQAILALLSGFGNQQAQLSLADWKNKEGLVSSTNKEIAEKKKERREDFKDSRDHSQKLKEIAATRQQIATSARLSQMRARLVEHTNDLDRFREKMASSTTEEERQNYKALFKEKYAAFQKLIPEYNKLAISSGIDPETFDIVDPNALPSKPGRLNQKSIRINLSDDALDQMAVRYAIRGDIANLGMGEGATKVQVYNRAAELFPGLNVAENMAAYGAQKGALNNIIKLQSGAKAYENTAMKNSRLMLGLMNNITDTNSPALNTPIRDLDRRVLGSQEQAMFDAALQVVIPEYARLLGNPALTGVVTQDVREEIENVINKGYSLKQMYGVMQVLAADAHNRVTAYDMAANEVQNMTGAIAKPKVRVRLKKDIVVNGRKFKKGDIGDIDLDEFDPSVYERVKR